MAPSKSMSAFGKAHASVSVTSCTGEKMMTPLGPNSHVYKIRAVKPHESGSKVGDHQMQYTMSEAFMKARKETKHMRIKIINEKLKSAGACSGLHQSQTQPQLELAESLPGEGRSSFAAKLRKEARESRNPELNKKQEGEAASGPKRIQPGQLENTEEILRKHYYIAKATQKTQHELLNKQVSPMKHMIKAQGLQGNEHVGMVHKVRGERLDTLQTQAASMMRLNAVWGLESKGPQVDRLKARVSQEEADQGGVFTDIHEGVKQRQIDTATTLTDLDAMIHFYLQQPEDTGFFIYLIPGDSGDPYDLVPLIDYQ